MNEALIYMLWIGGRMSAVARLAVASFLRHGHPVEVFAYDDIPNLPANATVRDARAILPARELERFAGFPVQFSDWFRWRLLGMHGGYWADTDVVCLRPFRFEQPIVFGNESDGQPNTAVLKVDAGAALASFIDARCEAPNRFRPEDDFGFRRTKAWRFLRGNRPGAIAWGEAGGPVGLLRAAKVLDVAHLALPYTVFYPVHWMNAGSLFDGTLGREVRFFSDTHAVHIWNSHLYKVGLGPDGPFARDSIMARWLNEHGI